MKKLIKVDTMKSKFTAFTEKHAEIWKFIKFTFTGASTSILYFIVYYLCEYIFFKSLNQTRVTDNAVLSFLGIKFVGTAFSYFIASFLSYVASYVMNRKVTFKSNSNIFISTVLFAVMVVVTTVFTTWFGAFMKTVLYDRNLDGGVLELLMPVVVMIIPFLWTYPFQKFVIYKNRNIQSDEDKEVIADMGFDAIED